MLANFYLDNDEIHHTGDSVLEKLANRRDEKPPVQAE